MGGKSLAYSSWSMMKQRCLNPKDPRYADYGGRGIAVCERWLKFENFNADMGERPKGTTLDRYPNKNGNYEPDNCRWATLREQQNNTRSNLVFEYKGERKTLHEWARHLNVNPGTLHRRLVKSKWPIEQAFTLPLVRGIHPSKRLALGL